MRSPVRSLASCLVLCQLTMATAQNLEFRDGDRVVWIGSAFVERLQDRGYLETELTSCQLDRKVTFRNLGWSGDNVSGEARAVFGKPEDGFKRLQRDLLQAKPTVVIVAYGANEAHHGSAGLASFRSGLLRLLKAIEVSKARVILVAPHDYESKPRPLPDPAPYNQTIKAYRKVLASVAREQSLGYVDLSGKIAQMPGLTDNGVHLTPSGYWRVAPMYAKSFGARRSSWSVNIKTGGDQVIAEGTKVTDLATNRHGLTFKARDRILPRPVPGRPLGNTSHAPRLRVQGLPPGKYELRIDGKARMAQTAEEWSAPKGVRLRRPAGIEQTEKLRRAIVFKNELYFHRYRPQNETYLFLFRKHEQGNNAVEVPQFEPLVKKLEAEISRLRQPQTHTYQLVRIRG